MLAQVFALTRAKAPEPLALPAGSLANRSPRRGRSRRSPVRCSTTTLLAFEVTSILLLAAVVGAVVLGKQPGE